MATYTYINYALYYKLDDSEKDKCVEGFGQTLSQTGHLCSSIEQDHDGDHLLQMHYGHDNPDAYPDAHLAVMAFKASFVCGGMVLATHMQHCTNVLSGWAGFIHQLAANYRADLIGSPYPSWDPACLDLSALDKSPVPENQRIDVPKSRIFDLAAPIPLPDGVGK
ncbi:hypothetical protein VTI28DRAFT_9896 [Corynascus sepedonium]